MVVLKLKILWLFLTVFQMGCVKSEEHDLEISIKSLDVERDANITNSKINHPISDELTTSNLGRTDNSTGNEGTSSLNYHSHNINEDIDKALYEGNYTIHVKDFGNNTKTTTYNRDIDSQDIFTASIEGDAEGSGDGFDDNFTTPSFSAESDGNEEQSFSSDDHDITVEDIFSDTDSNLKYPEPEFKSTSPKNDIIERWLTMVQGDLTWRNYKPHNISLSSKPLQYYVNFDGNYTSYDHSNRTVVDHEEKLHNRSKTEEQDKRNFPFPEQSNTEQQMMLHEDSLIGTINTFAQRMQTEDADNIQHNALPQQQETIGANTETNIQSVLRDFNYNDNFSATDNFKDTVSMNNITFEEENNKSFNESPSLQTYKRILSNLHSHLNETNVENKKIVEHNSNIPVLISEKKFTKIFPELVSTTQNVLLTNDKEFNYNTLLSNYPRNNSENLQNKLINQYNKKSETFNNNNSEKLKDEANKNFVQTTNIHNGTYRSSFTQTELGNQNQNVSKLNFIDVNRLLLNLDTKNSNVSLSALKLNEHSILNHLGKISIDGGTAELQISKPTGTILAKETNILSPNSTKTLISKTNLDERIFNEQLTTNKSSLSSQNNRASLTPATASIVLQTNNIKLPTSNDQEEISEKQFSGDGKHAQSSNFAENERSANMALLEIERNLNITTESRIAFLEDSDEASILSMNTSVTQKIPEDISYFYGRVHTNDGTVCASLNLTITILVNNTRIQLPRNISVEENLKLQNTDISLKWEAADNLYNLSTLFHVRCESGYCLMDSIHLTITQLTNTETFHDDIVLGESVRIQGKNLELFKTEPGVIYQNNAETVLSMNRGIKIYLANVKFFVAKDLNLSNQKGDKSASLFADYHTELIGGAAGILLLGGVALYTFKQLRKTKESFNPTVG